MTPTTPGKPTILIKVACFCSMVWRSVGKSINCHIVVAKSDVQPRKFDIFTLNLKKVQHFVSILHSCLESLVLFVTLDHKSSLKSLGYICSNSQKYIVWVKIIDFSFMPKIIRTLSKHHVPWRYFVNFLP